MTLIFKSTCRERVETRIVDSNGRARVAVATRNPGDFNWEMTLTHPSGRTWPGSYHGPAILDALGALIEAKHPEYEAEKGRGYRHAPEQYDRNRSLPDVGDHAPITMSNRDVRPPRQR